MAMADADARALEALVNEADLQRLDALLDRFNILEALGVVHQELRHSDLLACLLDPHQPHRLGDLFLKRFLQAAVAAQPCGRGELSPQSMEQWSAAAVEVRREWGAVDLLVLHHDERVAVVIENKIGSGEHTDQLRRYQALVAREFTGWRQLRLFLTPDGKAPSRAAYRPVSYQVVCEAVEAVIAEREATLDPDVRVLMVHYAEMLRRHIVKDAELDELCRRIYRDHRRALDLIWEHIPTSRDAAGLRLKNWVEEAEGLVLDDCTSIYVRFRPASWSSPVMKSGAKWTSSHQLMLFEFDHPGPDAVLYLVLGPGPRGPRERLYQLAKARPEVFRGVDRRLKEGWTTLHEVSLASRPTDDLDPDEIIELQRRAWEQFLTQELPVIDALLKAEAWLWAQESG